MVCSSCSPLSSARLLVANRAALFLASPAGTWAGWIQSACALQELEMVFFGQVCLLGVFPAGARALGSAAG